MVRYSILHSYKYGAILGYAEENLRPLISNGLILCRLVHVPSEPLHVRRHPPRTKCALDALLSGYARHSRLAAGTDGRTRPEMARRHRRPRRHDDHGVLGRTETDLPR